MQVQRRPENPFVSRYSLTPIDYTYPVRRQFKICPHDMSNHWVTQQNKEVHQFCLTDFNSCRTLQTFPICPLRKCLCDSPAAKYAPLLKRNQYHITTRDPIKATFRLPFFTSFCLCGNSHRFDRLTRARKRCVQGCKANLFLFVSFFSLFFFFSEYKCTRAKWRNGCFDKASVHY